jgi:plastocyanin
MVLRGAYPALMLTDEAVPAIWQQASAQAPTLVELLKGVSRLPAGATGDRIRTGLVAPIAEVLDTTRDAPLRAAAGDALVGVRPDAATFVRLANEITPTADPQVVTAAIRALARLPASVRPDGPALEALARAVMAVIRATPTARRTQPATTDAIHFAESLTTALPDASRVALGRDLRALGVQVVRLGTLVEQMLYDVRWFVVEAGKPVQVVFTNIEAMPHNVVIGRPGSLSEIATLGAAMPLPTDPAAKAYVPNTPLVLWSTRLVKEGETERINFTAPAVPGEYVFVCTFPGHATRMYGVMLVVPDRNAWDAKPVVPIDPMTKSPFTSERH